MLLGFFRACGLVWGAVPGLDTSFDGTVTDIFSAATLPPWRDRTLFLVIGTAVAAGFFFAMVAALLRDFAGNFLAATFRTVDLPAVGFFAGDLAVGALRANFFFAAVFDVLDLPAATTVDNFLAGVFLPLATLFVVVLRTALFLPGRIFFVAMDVSFGCVEYDEVSDDVCVAAVDVASLSQAIVSEQTQLHKHALYQQRIDSVSQTNP